MEPLLPGYNQGYTKAILDVEGVLLDILSYDKKSLNSKDITTIISLIAQNKDKYLYGVDSSGIDDGFIRYNHTTKTYEYYVPNK